MTTEETPRKWLIVFVKSYQEQIVCDQLSTRNIPHLAPVQYFLRKWGSREKQITQRLIPRLIFVFVNKKEQESIRKIPFVIEYMIHRNNAALVSPSELQMRNFKTMIKCSDGILEFHQTLPAKSVPVRIIEGVFKELKGHFYSAQDNKISMHFPPFGYITAPIQPNTTTSL